MRSKHGFERLIVRDDAYWDTHRLIRMLVDYQVQNSPQYPPTIVMPNVSIVGRPTSRLISTLSGRSINIDIQSRTMRTLSGILDIKSDTLVIVGSLSCTPIGNDYPLHRPLSLAKTVTHDLLVVALGMSHDIVSELNGHVSTHLSHKPLIPDNPSWITVTVTFTPCKQFVDQWSVLRAYRHA